MREREARCRLGGSNPAAKRAGRKSKNGNKTNKMRKLKGIIQLGLFGRNPFVENSRNMC